MGLNPIQLTDAQWSMMASADRKKFPRKLRMTQAEREHVRVTQLERKIHDQLESFCRRNGIDVWHSNPTRKSSIASGLPDFLCLKEGRGVGIEFKVAPNSLSQLQKERFAQLASHGNIVEVFTEAAGQSAYEAATRFLTEFFNLKEEL